MLGNLFKPRWRHRDADVRAQAATALNPDQDSELLARLARDDDSPRVRAAAAAALLDLSLLDQLIAKDTDAAVRDAASERIMALLAGTVAGAPAAETRLRLIRHTDNPRVLMHVVRHSPDAASREAALASIRDAESLYQLALHGKDAATRLAAAERLEDDERLRQLGREGRDKKVVRLARERLKAHQREHTEQERREEERGQTLDALEHLAAHSADPLFAARFGQLEQRWEALAEGADPRQAERAGKALEDARARLEQARQEERREAELAAARQERHAALDTLRALMRDLDGDTWDQQLGELRSAVATQERRWQAAAEEAPGDDDQELAFRSQLDEWRRLIALAEAARDNPDPEDRHALAEQWPRRVPAPSSLADLAPPLGGDVDAAGPAELTREASPRRSQRSRHQGLVVALRRELQRGNLKHANRLWLKAEAVLAEENDPWLARQLERHGARREELRDWHAFAAQPKKDALCERMEALIEQSMDADERASAIQALHDEWRALMSSDQDQDQALWDRFKAASDRAYEPCRAHFEELDAQRAENLRRRRALCDQLAAFVNGENWDKADWQAVWEIRRRAPQEWKDHSPVRFTDGRDLRKRFSALLSEIDEHLDRAWQEAERQRAGMIDRARALSEREDAHDAARQARELQKEWRAAPWLPPARHRRWQKDFRGLMDAIFGARQAASQARDEARQAERERAAALLDDGERRLRDDPLELDDAALAALIGELDGLDHGALERGQQRRKQQLLDSLRRRRADLPRWHRWRDAEQRLAAAPDGEASDQDRALAVALEALAGVDSPEHARAERMAWQLEQLPRAMKSAGYAPLEEALKLVEQRDADAPLDPALRQRMTVALAAVEPHAG
ncbi:DUF349 domain-containing protein [Alloalcanivorax marinus]|uniref:DUF349 domain-containing protein n=1 Tax=Alloalcanivorax marinus TaxID=1177169 RepID=UPI001932D2AC|nr:DUF349 domain-containing protein [Alloalcanivorax marinus]MBL7249829.1 DUF349 domain-containing protein [Alloalcanivorax marinus]